MNPADAISAALVPFFLFGLGAVAAWLLIVTIARG